MGRFTGDPHPIELLSYDDLLNDRTGAGYYWDHEVGAVFRRFQVDLPRDPEIREACVPSISHKNHCPDFYIKSASGTLGSTDCTDRAYPKYKKDPL